MILSPGYYLVAKFLYKMHNIFMPNKMFFFIFLKL